MRFVIEIVTHLTGIIMEEVYRFAHFGNGVAERFPRFAHQQANQLLHLVFHQYRRPLQNGGAFLRRRRKPNRRLIDRVLQRLFNLAFCRFASPANNIFRFRRVDNRRHLTVGHRLFQHRFGLPFLHGVA
ncbi:Uncharacterised protein [Salmonella enterica subsp. enterica serovar Bovismorbificans]|nr:Uncharacterised protein [Salmonella enterica subsp. enterica serovar Bovismorbificans]CNU17974.1 Uncharacterised protein [Salmonella enterica subsp. enterica serovar Bovismorbificans]CNU53435.1 Uncharacterised protein [Salmonella enterica subsp. enterica serovar Bovismorbificans]CNU61193.1 Uncharacterised protein [Salmonella enterica subsp. enterica serovar Bovismorbificans]CPR54511.1 Uncharacterised protein [Salmonella enterica subsp. enterica serovar Bovismorbificans]